LVVELLERNADPSVVDNNGFTPYVLALAEGQDKIAEKMEEMAVAI
jgi:ankyrin repeat protein